MRQVVGLMTWTRLEDAPPIILWLIVAPPKLPVVPESYGLPPEFVVPLLPLQLASDSVARQYPGLGRQYSATVSP